MPEAPESGQEETREHMGRSDEPVQSPPPETFTAAGAAPQGTVQPPLSLTEQLRRAGRSTFAAISSPTAPRSDQPSRLSIGSTAELFEALRLGIVDKAEARRLLGLEPTEGGGDPGQRE